MPSSIKDTFYVRLGKQCLDTMLALVALSLLSFFLFAIAIAIRLSSAGPALFRQVRTGRFGKPFRILKFRTMMLHQGEETSLLTARNDPRITSLGRWLRASKADELPQLINVLCGQMSLVGPRPEVPLYTARYTTKQRAVLEMRPGVTGPTSNANVDEEEMLAVQADKEEFYVTTLMPAKLESDIAYCENISLSGDVTIILETLKVVFARAFDFFRTMPRASQKRT